MKKFCAEKMDEEVILDFIDFFNSYVSINAMVQGRVEQWVSIVDAADVGISEIPLFLIQKFSKRATTNFKQRNGMTIYVNLHWMLRVAVTLVEQVLDELQLKCNAFFKSDYTSFVDETFGLENVQEKYGGKLPNVDPDNVQFPPLFNF